MRKVDWKYILITLLLLVVFVLYSICPLPIKNSVKQFLTFPSLNWYAGGFTIILTIVHKIKMRKIVFNGSMSFKDFRASINDVISFIDNPIVIVGSLALGKGLFLYYTENVHFFPFLNGYEITLILLVTFYLLFISLIEVWNNIVDICRQQSQNGDVVATPLNERKDKEIPQPQH